MPKCGNPECGKEIEEDKAYCNEECLRRSYELKPKKRGIKIESSMIDTDSSIEATLKYMGIEKTNFTKDVAYRHWERFIQFAKDNSGKNYHDFIRPRLRSYIGVDFRYIDDFLESCLAWGVIELKDRNLYFLGLPKEEKANAT